MQVLVLLWLINFTPPLLAHFLEDKWSTPLDLGRSFRDGYPLFGPHKTQRGVLGGITAGLLIGTAFGFPWWVGLMAGALSMAGDLLSSFIKRRGNLPSGDIVPGLDQAFEGILPFLVLGPHLSLKIWEITFIFLLFGIGAYVGSLFLTQILRAEPHETYPRPISPRVRLREFRACQITSNPFHHLLNFEDCFYYHLFMKNVFRLAGIYERGKRNALHLKKTPLTLSFADLPPSFDGYTILFISDLHLDGLEGLTEQLLAMIGTLPVVDLCIIGGDLRMETYGPFDKALAHLCRLIPEIRTKDGIYGVLGNHDCTEAVEPLEKIGMRFLINDNAAIERNGEKMWIAGVDDPHYYRCHDLEQAFDKIPPDSFTIFLAHSNEIYKEAVAYAPQLYLCGHTHAGQIEIPGYGPIFTHSRAPRKLCQGVWYHGGITGYTTSGVGVSGVPVRFNSQGEVVIITLKSVSR